MSQPRRSRAGRRRGFTLVELLVVITIVILVSAVTLPAVLPALGNRQLSEAARILQATLAGARDAAVRANAPRGIRLVFDNSIPGALTVSRIVPIEPAPELSEGMVTFPNIASNGNTGGLLAQWSGGSRPTFPFPAPLNTAITNRGNYPYVLPSTTSTQQPVLLVEEAVFSGNVSPAPNVQTNWFWNVRIGDRFRFADSGRYYTVVGPMTIPNPEFYVNDGLPGANPTLVETYPDATGTTPVNATPEYLFLVNGIDDNNDGYIDNGVNGVDEDLNGQVDNLAEWVEVEQWFGSQVSQSINYQVPPGHFNSGATPVPVLPTFSYTIARRPVPTPGALEVTLPPSVVIDLTTILTTRERSRLPVDPNNTSYFDIMLNQAGQVIPTTTYSNPASVSMDQSFYHFWLADRGDVFVPNTNVFPQLPIPAPPGALSSTMTSNYPPPVGTNASSNFVTPYPFLRKDRMLLTLFTRTGQIVTNSIENFDFANAFSTSYDQNVPFDNAQVGIREAQ